jgi:hypothetical protein
MGRASNGVPPCQTNRSHTMGIDIGKNSFHLVGLDQRGAIVLRQKWSRSRIEARLAPAFAGRALTAPSTVPRSRRLGAMLAFGKRVGPDLFAYAPICPEVGAANPPMGYRWSGASLSVSIAVRGTKKTELIESS